MLDVPHGTGINKSVSNARITGFSTAIKYVYPFLTNVPLSITLELALPAIRDITLTTANALKPLLNKFQMLDAPLGIGISKLVFNVQTTGSLINTESASQYPTNAPLSIKLEPVSLATKDTTLTTENALWLQFNKFQMSDVPLGTGTNKSA